VRTSPLERLKRHLRPGRVYRREDLLPWSRSVDRHLKELTVGGTLQKLRTGLYYSPRKFEFGEAPADEHELVKAFLKTDRFVVTSPNAYNQLGLGTTQLYNRRVVYNKKRHGTFPLGNRMVTFERRMNVPRQLSPEFLLVDLVNELGDLEEDRDAVLSRVREKAKEMDPKKLSLHAEKVSGDAATCPLSLFCTRETMFAPTPRVHPDPLNSRFAYISISRVSHEATIFTDDLAKLAPQLGTDVSKTSALEITAASPVARAMEIRL
jgi:hypothetical protein